MRRSALRRIAFAGAFWLAVLAASAGGAGRPDTYVLVGKTGSGDYWVRCHRGAARAAAELGVKVLFAGPELNDSAMQISMIEGYVSDRVRGIAVSVADPRGIEEIIRKAVRRDVPVVTFDTDSPASERHMYVGTNNAAAGRTAGLELVKAMEGKGTVAILHGGVADAAFRMRLEGLRKAVDEAGEIEIVALEDCRNDPALAVAQAENILQKYPRLGAFVATSSVGAPAAVAALRARGRAGKVKVIGFDLDEANAKSISRGWITAVVEQQPERMGELAIRWLRRISLGERPPARNLYTDVEVVTIENVEKAAERLRG